MNAINDIKNISFPNENNYSLMGSSTLNITSENINKICNFKKKTDLEEPDCQILLSLHTSISQET